jgi:putative transposase
MRILRANIRNNQVLCGAINDPSGAYHHMITSILDFWKSLGRQLTQVLKRWTKPATAVLAAETLSDITRSRVDLIIENAMLRQQLIVLNRQVKRPQLTQPERIRLVLLARCTQFWRQALHIVQPDTLLRWHRDLFRRYWRRKSKNKKRKPRTSQETIDLIRQIAQENPLWGAEHIRGELLKLGVRVSKRTIQKYMPKAHRNSGQTWATFLKNHISDIWACDFTVVHTLFFQPLYILVFIELETRRIIYTAVTASPTDQWAAQQLREATPWGQGPKYLIRDRDNKYGPLFASVAEGTKIEILKTPIQAPEANAHCERFIGSLKWECLDHMFILNRRQLHRVVQEYKGYYNHSRPHQGIEQRIPGRFHQGLSAQNSEPKGRVISTPVLGGLHHTYSRAAYLH